MDSRQVRILTILETRIAFIVAAKEEREGRLSCA